MDKDTAKELITLIDSKIKSLEESKAEILGLVKEEDNDSQIGLQMTTTAIKIPLNGSSETTRQVYTALIKIGKSVSPKHIFEYLKESGYDIPDSRVRQILMRWKGRLFKSPQRGLWRAIKYD
ncbi:MAG: hypothetical protein JSU85_09640 [Candidatus Zixiibacteriota bacterium]|nr:MAG: hypothetical protein JSU85_09640 [candidate division Zixibacteria bacterium]